MWFFGFGVWDILFLVFDIDVFLGGVEQFGFLCVGIEQQGYDVFEL